MQDLDTFYLNKPEPNKSCLLALRHIILSINEEVSETVKYGMPCFCFKNKAFTYLWTDKKTNEPYILFVEGKQIDHPDLEAGNRSRMKTFRVNPNADIELETIRELLQRAIELYRK